MWLNVISYSKNMNMSTKFKQYLIIFLVALIAVSILRICIINPNKKFIVPSLLAVYGLYLFSTWLLDRSMQLFHVTMHLKDDQLLRRLCGWAGLGLNVFCLFQLWI